MRILLILLAVAVVAAGCYGPDARKRAAQLEFEKGKRLYDRCFFEGAKKCFEHSLWLNPKHQAASDYLRAVNGILAIPEKVEVE